MTDFPQLLDLHELSWLLESDDLDELRGLHDALSDQLGKVDARIHELEQDRGNPEERELRRDYRASVL